MVANFAAGGAAVNAFAANSRVDVRVVDVGVATASHGLDIVHAQGPPRHARSVRRAGPDRGRGAARRSRSASTWPTPGRRTATAACSPATWASRNTTASAALIAAFTGSTAEVVTGRGTGIDDATLAHKTAVIDGRSRAARRPGDGSVEGAPGVRRPRTRGPGRVHPRRRRATRCRSSWTGSSPAPRPWSRRRSHPAVIDYCVAGHRSAEPGHAVALKTLGLQPLVDLDLRLGEGTGAVLAYPILTCAVRALREMATFESAGIELVTSPVPVRPACSTGRRVVVVGGGGVAQRRLPRLLESGAHDRPDLTVDHARRSRACSPTPSLTGPSAATSTATWTAPGTSSWPPTTPRSTTRCRRRPRSDGSSASGPTTDPARRPGPRRRGSTTT